MEGVVRLPGGKRASENELDTAIVKGRDGRSYEVPIFGLNQEQKNDSWERAVLNPEKVLKEWENVARLTVRGCGFDRIPLSEGTSILVNSAYRF